MKHIFYFLTIFPIFWELHNLFNIKKTHQFFLEIKANKGKNFDEWTENRKYFSVLMLGYIFWNFIGFFSSQWVLFVSMFLLGLIPKKYIWHRWIDSLISFLILCFIILNAYHFKIDVWQWILSNI